MALHPIVRFPDPRLRKPTHRVESITSEIRRLVEDMVETMYACQAAGLAAIQIGSFERIFVIDPGVAGKTKQDDPVVFINPEMEWLSPNTESKEEGCLSFPSIFLPVRRSLQARTKALDLQGHTFIAEGTGLYARALQHEMDHLNNKLLFDYAGPLKRKSIQRFMERMTDEEAEQLLLVHGE